MPTFDALGIVAADLPATLSFYRLVGLDIPLGADGHVEVELDGGFRVMFDSVEIIESFSTYEPARGGRNVALAFRCASPNEVDATFVRALDAGHGFREEPFDTPWGQRYATLLDPDGNPVDLYAPLDPDGADPDLSL
jgi:catechol 2,3-dioxygenase-like lactoylglutathione lyase family enzyme